MTEGKRELRGATRIADRCKVQFRVVDTASTAEQSTAEQSTAEQSTAEQSTAEQSKKASGETLNISTSGLCLAAPMRLRPDTHIALEMSLIEREEPVIAMGRVVWCDPDGDLFRVGICFTWVRDEDVGELARVADYIEARLGSSD